MKRQRPACDSYRGGLACFVRIGCALLCLFWGQQSFAQISSGGSPPSFSYALQSVVPTLMLPELDAAALLREDSLELWSGSDNDPVAPRFAFAHEVLLHPANSGNWETLPDGTRIWRLRIVSPGARAIHLVYGEWMLSKGVRLFLYDDEHQAVLGAFTARNNWPEGTNITGPVRGDATTLELAVPAGMADEAWGNLSISQVCHAYRDLFSPERPQDMFGDSHDCQVNINCPAAAEFADEKRGVVMIISGATRWCSGSLVADVTQDWRPYVLTASHCLNGNQNSWLFIFNYESPGCTDEDAALNQSVANATLRAAWPFNQGSDMALLELSNSVPASYNPYFIGWDRSDVPAPGVTGISHPHGDVKKYARDNGTPTHDDWGSGPPNTHWRLNYDIGGMEAGSSGSPALNEFGRIIGQLTGGYEACNIVDESWYGKFGAGWEGGGTPATRLRDWLDPFNTNPDHCDGVYPVPPMNDDWPTNVIWSLPFTQSGTTAYANDNLQSTCGGTGARDVVFCYIANCDGRVTASTCGSGFDTAVSVHLHLNSGEWEEIACNDDDSTCGALTGSRVTFDAYMGMLYHIVLDGLDSSSSGEYTISISGDVCGPSRVVIKKTGSGMLLDWEDVPGTFTYNVYRLNSAEDLPSAQSLIATTPESFYYDTGIVWNSRETCFYSVTAVTPQ